MSMIETKGDGVREAWRGAWGVVLRWAPVIVGAQAGFYGLVLSLFYLLKVLPEWLCVVLLFLLPIPFFALVIYVFFSLTFTIEARVIALVEGIAEREGMWGDDGLEKVKTFGGLSSVFLFFVPTVVFVVVVVVIS